MRFNFLIGLMTLPLIAQQAAEKPAAEQSKPAVAETAPAPPTEPAPAAPAEASPVPAEGPAWSGNVDFGYRWVSDIGGSFNTYRTVVVVCRSDHRARHFPRSTFIRYTSPPERFRIGPAAWKPNYSVFGLLT